MTKVFILTKYKLTDSTLPRRFLSSIWHRVWFGAQRFLTPWVIQSCHVFESHVRHINPPSFGPVAIPIFSLTLAALTSLEIELSLFDGFMATPYPLCSPVPPYSCPTAKLNRKLYFIFLSCSFFTTTLSVLNYFI